MIVVLAWFDPIRRLVHPDYAHAYSVHGLLDLMAPRADIHAGLVTWDARTTPSCGLFIDLDVEGAAKQPGQIDGAAHYRFVSPTM